MTERKDTMWIASTTLIQSQAQPALMERLSRVRIFPVLKRAIDVTFAFMVLALSLPLALVIALAVKLDSRGPVFYKQVRVGLNRRHNDRRRGYRRSRPSEDGRRSAATRRAENLRGRPFTILKFRTMQPDAERNGAQWCQEGDPRVTRVGRVLRTSHLDELPQLVNIIRGEMSVVGPRPERPEIISQLSSRVPDYERRLDLKPGLTGLAQISHRADLEIRDVRRKVRYDLLYQRKAAVATDLKIIAGTVPMAFGMPAETWRRFRKRRPMPGSNGHARLAAHANGSGTDRSRPAGGNVGAG